MTTVVLNSKFCSGQAKVIVAIPLHKRILSAYSVYIGSLNNPKRRQRLSVETIERWSRYVTLLWSKDDNTPWCRKYGGHVDNFAGIFLQRWAKIDKEGRKPL